MGRIVCLDFGTKRIGVAISDERKILARPLGMVLAGAKFFEELKKLLRSEGVIEKIVIGLPLKMSGQDSAMTTMARSFAEEIKNHFPYPVELWDERLTSMLVEKALSEAGASRKRRAEVSDTLSAVVILQSYLDKT